MILLDIDYYLSKENKPIIRLWCKDSNGNTKLIEDDTFEPYFYASGGDLNKLKEFVDSIEIKRKDEVLKVKRVESKSKLIEGKPKDVLVIYTHLPGHVPLFRDKIKKKGYDLWEADILFPMRYLIDRNLKPFDEIDDNLKMEY